MHMSDQATITSETALMMEKMVGLDPSDPRYMVLKAALDYKASWIDLAEHLNVVAANKDYKEWGYKAFKDYCDQELQIRQVTARKLVRGFQWIDQEAPELLPRLIDDQVDVAARDASVILPDVDTVDVLVKAQKEVAKERLSRDAYDDLKERALRGEQTVSELKQDLKDAVITPEPDPKKEQLKLMRRSLRAAEKMVEQFEELGIDDQEIVELAANLREKLFEFVAGMLDEQAYKDGEGSEGNEGSEGAPAEAEEPAEGGQKTEKVTVIVGSKDQFTGG
jgi:hypothetical protein